jgi:hypothetical protein
MYSERESGEGIPIRKMDLIVVGTFAWYNWLEHHTVSPLLIVLAPQLVRKSGTGPDSSYWEADQTRHGKLSGQRDRLGVAQGVSGTRPRHLVVEQQRVYQSLARPQWDEDEKVPEGGWELCKHRKIGIERIQKRLIVCW